MTKVNPSPGCCIPERSGEMPPNPPGSDKLLAAEVLPWLEIMPQRLEQVQLHHPCWHGSTAPLVGKTPSATPSQSHRVPKSLMALDWKMGHVRVYHTCLILPSWLEGLAMVMPRQDLLAGNGNLNLIQKQPVTSKSEIPNNI